MNALAPKASKASVNYSPGMKSAHCGICEHFQPPHGCEVVLGEINSNCWCRKFKRK